MLPLLTILAPILGDVVKRVVPDKVDQQKIQAEIQLALLEHTDSLEKLRGQIVLEEAKSQHWMVATWRPLLMLVVVAIIALNYLFFPILGIITGTTHELILPTELWTLLQLGVGGYVVGRSGEKMVDKWRGPDL